MSPAPVDPVDAASMLLVRDGAEGLEVLVVVRATSMAFMGGATAFPGGRVDPADDAGDGAAFRSAAIRETFEETGILLARARGEEELLADEAAAPIRDRWRSRLLAGSAHLAEMLAAERLDRADDLLVPAAHWITPEDLPRRFDTRFFIAPAPAQTATLEGSEHAHLAWLAPRRALADAEAGTRTLALATHTILTGLSASPDVAAALAAARTRRITPVLPWYEGTGEHRRAVFGKPDA